MYEHHLHLGLLGLRDIYKVLCDLQHECGINAIQLVGAAAHMGRVWW